VGRRKSLRDLRSAIADAVAGAGRLVFITGEPGIGKTSLAQQACALAAESGMGTLWGSCWEGDGAPPFWPWVQVLRDYSAGRDAATLQRELGTEHGDLGMLIPELAGGSAESGPPQITSNESRFRLYDSVSTFLLRVAKARPTLVVLDDLHWADEPSLQLLRFLGSGLDQRSLLVLGTYRDVEVGLDHPLRRVIGQMTGAAHELQLEGLAPAEVGELVAQLTGAPAPEPQSDAIHRLTNGNPFFVRELIRLQADPIAADARLPQGVREVVRHRLGSLSTASREVLAAAAVAGPDFEPELVSRVAGVPAKRVGALLDEATGARLLERGPVPDRHRFVHTLVREVLYGDLPLERRRHLHHRTATAIEQLHAGDLIGREAELAHHYREAGGRASLERALELTESAAQQSLRLFAHEDAAMHLRRALELVDPLNADDRRRCLILLSLSRAEMASGEGAAARDASTRAADVARRMHAPDLLAQAALGLQPEFTAQSVHELEVSLLEEAAQSLGPERIDLRARLLARLARALIWSPATERRQALITEAEALARGLGDPATTAAVRYECHQAVCGLPTDDPGARLQMAEESIRLALHSGDQSLALHTRALRLGDLLELGDMQRYRAEVGAYAGLVERLRQLQVAWHSPLQRATLAMLEGRFDEAEALAADGLALGRRVQHAGIENFYGAFIGFSRMLQGRLAGTVELMQLGVRTSPFQTYRAGLALAWLWTGQTDDARAEFERLAAGDFLDLPRDVAWLGLVAVLSVVCSSLHDRPRARQLYELVLPCASRNVRITRIGIGCGGSVEHYLGLLCATLGNLDEAVLRFEAAVRFHRRMASPVLVAHSRFQLARALAARGGRGDLERSRVELEQAAEVAAALGIDLAPGEKTPPSSQVDFHRDGDFWTLHHGAQVMRLRDSVGLRHLARLVAEPGREFHAMDLASPERIGFHQAGDAGQILDERAKAEYRERLRELAQEIDEADAWSDPERAAKARREVDMLTQQLASAVGLGGRDRKALSDAERARVTVTKAIRAAIQRIGALDTDLGAHLEVSVRTGVFCAYRPDPASRITWAVD
jgi:tetratricopeptide (TPR) repeat protein